MSCDGLMSSFLVLWDCRCEVFMTTLFTFLFARRGREITFLILCGGGGEWEGCENRKLSLPWFQKFQKSPPDSVWGKRCAIWYWISQTVVYLDERFTGDFEILQKTYLLKQFISGGNFIFPDDFISFYRLWFKQYFLRKSRVQLLKIPMVSRKWSIIPLWF